jgi:homopolymeric O-antigen transport system permease protein
MMSGNRVKSLKTIRPDSRASAGVLQACKQLWQEVYKFRGQIWTVYKQNFRSSYHGAGLGVLWNFILPLVPLTVYLFLTRIRVFPSFEGVDGSTYLTFGVMIWFVFVGFVQIPIGIVQSRTKQSMKTSLPLSTSIVASFAGLIFETVVRMVFVIGIMVITKSWPNLTAPALLLVFLPGFLLFFGTGLILSIMNVIYKDVSRLTTILLQYGIFVSGVIFPLGNSELAIASSKVNPFAVFVNASRDIVFQGRLEHWVPFAIWSAIGLGVFLIGCRLFYVMEYRIREIN